MTNLKPVQVDVTDDFIIVNPAAEIIDQLPGYYAGILAIGARMQAEGKVLDSEQGVVASDSDPMKCYAYDDDTAMMVAATPVRSAKGMNYRRWRDDNGHFIASQGYKREFKTTMPSGEVETREREMAYDSHHIAWLLTTGMGFKVKKTEWAMKRLYQEQCLLAGAARRDVFGRAASE